MKKYIPSIATAMLLLTTLSAFSEDVRTTFEVIQEVSIADDGVVTTTITENGVTWAPIVSIAPVGGELTIVGDSIVSALNNLDPALGNLRLPDQKNLDALIQKQLEQFVPRIRQRMAEQQAAELVELSKALGMSADEFDAIKPLLARVENLRQQKSLIDGPANSMMSGASDRGPRGLKVSNPQALLGDRELDPTVVEIQKAAKALKALVHDKQANASELTSAVVRLQKSRDSFSEVLNKAQNDLRAVLTSPQEAVLMVRGTLD